MMKNRTKIAIAGVAAGALAITAMVINKHLEIQRENDTDTIIRETDDTTYGSLEGKLPEKETQMPAEEPMTEVTPNTEENLTEMSPEPEMKTEEYETDAFYISQISDDIFAKMQGKSYKADCTIDREELRYVHILHTGFDGETNEGELVVNKAIADDVLAIFEELYRAKYPIEKVRLVDEYDANAAVYVDRSEDHPYRIDHDDLCYKLFIEHGFTWGGDWVHSKDYQHFEKAE